MRDPSETIVAVCRLPVDYRLDGKLSAVDLVRRSGYVADRAQVTVDRLADCLARHPDWVDAWFAWSEDTRGTPASYLLHSGDEFRVGLYDAQGRSEEMRLDDKVSACAEYVHREIEAIANLA